MKLSAKQQLDLDTCKYFIPSTVVFDDITEDDIEKFFAWSDKGIGKKEIAQEAMTLQRKNSGLSALYWGKQRRDLQVTSYIEDWGKYITVTDLASEEPEFMCKWLSKVMKKPAIYTMWKVFNGEGLNSDDLEILQPLRKLINLTSVMPEHRGQE